eukprot:15484934-Alexandrium_andersonii.AAC.1
MATLCPLFIADPFRPSLTALLRLLVSGLARRLQEAGPGFMTSTSHLAPARNVLCGLAETQYDLEPLRPQKTRTVHTNLLDTPFRP